MLSQKQSITTYIMKMSNSHAKEGSRDIQAENTQRKAWNRIAPGYDRFVTDTEKWVAQQALDFAGLKAGHRFLDVAAGCGGLSLPAARNGAAVVATDWAPEMIRRLKERARKEQLANVEALVMNGYELDLNDDTFDLVGSQFGVMLFSDIQKAIKEMTRVTRPGGKVLLIAYGNPGEIDFLRYFISALQTVRPDFQGLPNDPPPPEFQLADPQVLQDRLRQAGLKDIQIKLVTEHLTFSSGEELWHWIVSGNPIVGSVLSMLQINESEEQVIKDHLDQVLSGLSSSDHPPTLSSPINIGYGTK